MEIVWTQGLVNIMAIDRDHRQTPASPARRHFLAAASAASARIALLTTVATVARPGESKAFDLPAVMRGSRGDGSPSCYLRGTQILAPSGERSIETLAIGDMVTTASGAEARVRWIGRTSYEFDGTAWPENVVPVRIARDAIAAGVPNRDLYVSPWHFVAIDSWLIPARDLINDATVTLGAPAGPDRLDYIHVLLEDHHLLVANGMTAESLLLKRGEHLLFDNGGEYERLYGDREVAMEPCLPRIWYSGGRSHLKALLRIGVSHIIDVRDPIQKINAKIAARAMAVAA